MFDVRLFRGYAGLTFRMQRLTNCGPDKPVDVIRSFEFYFTLCGMNIHIDHLIVYLKEKEISRVSVSRNDVPVRVIDRMIYRGIFYRALIYENKLMTPRRPAQLS